MIVEVVFGAVLILLGFCALLGLPTLAFHLYGRDKRSHAFEQVAVADNPKVENKIADVYEDKDARREPTRDATESGAAYQ